MTKNQLEDKKKRVKDRKSCYRLIIGGNCLRIGVDGLMVILIHEKKHLIIGI